MAVEINKNLKCPYGWYILKLINPHKLIDLYELNFKEVRLMN